MKCTIDDLWYKADPVTGKKNAILTPLGERMTARPVRQRGDRYRVRYPKQLHRPNLPKSKTFRTLNEATAHASDVNRNGIPSPGGAGRWNKATGTVREYVDIWREANRPDHRPTTARQLASYVRLHIDPIMGDWVMNDVTSTDVKRWEATLRAEPDEKRKDLGAKTALSAKTVSTIRAHVKAIFTAAHDDARIDRNPFKTTEAKRRKRRTKSTLRKVTPPTAAEVRAVADAIPARYRAVVLAAAGSGLRQGELWALEPKHIDLENGTITVEQQVQMIDANRYLAPPKSAAGYRTVEIASYARDALAEHMKLFPPVDVEPLEDRRDEERPPGVATPKLIFTTNDGRQLNRSQWNSMWMPVQRRLGVRFRFHDLRHYYATVLIRAGKDVKEVQEALGHASAALVLETYAGYWPTNDASQRDALDGDWWK